MDRREYEQLLHKINRAKVVSFDIFDTLLFRKVNSPETIFDLVGKHFRIHGFRKIRMDAQNEASRIVYKEHQYPHANMDDIYDVLSRREDIPVNWESVKQFEIQMEEDALVANQEMLEVFRYAKARGKRVIAISDMYLSAANLEYFLVQNGFTGFDHIYCSADEHKAKFNRDLFECVAQKEGVAYQDILHIGDKERDDVEFPSTYGMDAFLYRRDADLQDSQKAAGSDMDVGLYKILADADRGFWYNLGVRVGGPLYMGLYQFVRDIITKSNKKVFFLSRDGYNLYQLFREQGFSNIEYLYTSRRAMTMASIREMNDQDIESLPPYTFGQSVGEILEYLQVDKNRIEHLDEVGFHSFADVIRTEEDRRAFQKLYTLDKGVFLERCQAERKNALSYLNKVGFFDQDALCFDCGWQGSSQELFERFKKVTGHQSTQHDFIYFGIRNSQKSRKQLRGMHYTTYLFDFYKNFGLQSDVAQNVVLYELFFSAPQESLYYYGDSGKLVFEDGERSKDKEELKNGICAFVREGIEFADKYEVEFRPDISVGQLKRLIHFPSEEEAVTIGNLCNVDGFAKSQAAKKYVAFVTEHQLAAGLGHGGLYWLDGLLARPDVPDSVKRKCAALYGTTYPSVPPEYHLEEMQSIRNYHRWIRMHGGPEDGAMPVKDSVRFSVVIPVYNTATDQLEACIESVLSQTYPNYELILVDDHSSWESVVPTLRKYETAGKVKVIYRTVNGHISAATNDGIQAANGDFIVFMDCDDTIEPYALLEFARKLEENPDLDFIYSDEDKITEDGKICHLPFFKPDWSPDLFLSMMYTNHLATYRASIVKEIGGLRTAYNGSQDYDFTLRFLEKSDNCRVGHVPKVLYHWRERKESVAFAMNSKNYAAEAARSAKEDYIRRNRLNARLEFIAGMSQYRIVYGVEGSPLVSIVIPSKDHPEVLKQCIDSIRSFTEYQNYEIIVVDNGSCQKNREAITGYLKHVGATYLYKEEPFNFSRMCNCGARCAKGEYLLFMNDDVEVFQPDWLARMLGQAQRKHTGAVGAKLYYPMTTSIQHAGCANLVKEGPVHSFMTLDDQCPYYFGWNWVDVNCSIVTGACLMVNCDKYWGVGGFDENFPVAYNDVKLCFELLKDGYYNVVRNDVAAYHHESLSRGTDQEDNEKLLRLHGEKASLYAACPEMNGRDPFLNPNLHSYDASLDLIDAYDRLEEVDLSDCVPVQNASIDQIEVTQQVRIMGWSVIDGEDHMAEIRRYVIVQDSFGQAYRALAFPVERADVAEHFGKPGYLYAGFECILSREEFRTDIMSYQVGVMTVDRNGRRNLCWCRNSAILRLPKARPMDNGSRSMDSFAIKDRQAECRWYVDSCAHDGGHYRIQGFAFKRGDTHYLYRTTLILLGNDGQALKFDPQPDERIDVAYSFPEEHFLFDTGFICYVFEAALEPGRTYSLIIRLSNRFHPEDILDIPTGKTIEAKSVYGEDRNERHAAV